MPAKAGMLLNSEMAAAAGAIASSWMASAGTTTFSMDTSNTQFPDPDPYPLERVADPDPTSDPSLFS
jgi:hypothetical protein